MAKISQVIDFLLKDNYCQDVDYCTHIDNRGMNWQASACQMNGSLWQGLYAVNYQNPPWSTAYPEIVNIAEEQPCVPVFNVIENNQYCGNGNFTDGWTIQQAQSWNDTVNNNTYSCR